MSTAPSAAPTGSPYRAGAPSRDVPANSNGRDRPPAGTQCNEACVIHAGRWGATFCYTEPDGYPSRQWGAECAPCPSAAPTAATSQPCACNGLTSCSVPGDGCGADASCQSWPEYGAYCNAWSSDAAHPPWCFVDAGRCPGEGASTCPGFQWSYIVCILPTASPPVAPYNPGSPSRTPVTIAPTTQPPTCSEVSSNLDFTFGVGGCPVGWTCTAVDHVSLLRAGGADAPSGFEVRLAVDNSVVCSARTGTNTDTFFEDTCSGLAPHASQQVYMVATDAEPGGWAKTYIDRIQFKDVDGSILPVACPAPTVPPTASPTWASLCDDDTALVRAAA
eukprot:gene57816-biopygen89623